ncbi:uncharacterized protein LOC110430620 [Sorghum bicolor]|uniref:TNFR-Cys domain-containing protein n=1 Tax=Sorghum bicolor TaxID=4558 RepID=A0A1B6P6W7_SORBI|nr:uncharacterized protein LOC110430620 [Sorghum bicolor]KXG21458.1 hypothetical protein SORBI_3009G065800 [Sorghum bicolor]|eukprot:XP_021304132.1 uncharacterized protein LOC110430620 [Sorghum bicolor]
MAFGAAAAAYAAAVAVFAIMVLSSLGHPETGPLCSDCGLLCTMNCTTEIATKCRSYCENPSAGRQYCQRQVFQACTLSFCCNGNCSRDCDLEAQNGCHVHDTTIDCQSCRGGVLQYCIPTCNSNCNSTCVKKDHGC